MPHLRKRHIDSLLKKTLQYSPVTGVFGHRQVGKTTTVSELAEKYITLDDIDSLQFAENSPKMFLEGNVSSPLVIDECQMAPPLFPAIKEFVRLNKKPGQFLLSGSVRFSSRKAIRESLTGRIIAWELLPMDLNEMHSLPLSQKLDAILESKTIEIKLSSPKFFTNNTIDQKLVTGGLPGVFAVRNESIRTQRFQTQLNTILERDLKLLFATSLSYRTILNFVTELSKIQGEGIDFTRLSRVSRISVPTIKKILAALESLFLIRFIPTVGTEKKPVLFFEDQGEATFLNKNQPSRTYDIIRFLFSELRTQVAYQPELGIEVFQYRKRGGALIPLCFKKKNKAVGIIPVEDEVQIKQYLASAKSFIQYFPGQKVFFVHENKIDKIHHEGIRSIEVSQLL